MARKKTERATSVADFLVFSKRRIAPWRAATVSGVLA
jgi:hypothetical protein